MIISQVFMRNFAIRFVGSLVIFGAVYVLIFGFPFAHHKLTPMQKLAALRASLDQGYIYGNSLAQFKQNSPVAYADLSELFSQFKASTSQLQTTLSAAKNELTTSQQNATERIIQSQREAAVTFQNHYTALSKVITYNPSTDLGELNITKDSTKLGQRSAMAQTGLTNATNTNGINVATVQTIQGEASCFGNLKSELASHLFDQVSATRNQCIKNYPTVRQSAITDTVQAAFTNGYEDDMKTQVSTLLLALDKRMQQ